MPNENPSPPRFLAKTETLLHALQLYGAGGIAAFGWALGALLGHPTGPWLPLWFCAALVVYNVDRLRLDPADGCNVPQRTAACGRWRGALLATVALATLGLVGLPVWRRDWLTLGLVLGGGVIALGYSVPVPVFGRRWKDVPLVKTLFAPAVVTAAIFGLLLRGELATLPGGLAFPRERAGLIHWCAGFGVPAAWAFCYLLFNMLLCDLRDLAGDRRFGIRSLPALWTESGTRALLRVLVALGAALLLLWWTKPAQSAALILLGGGAVAYQWGLLRATRRPRSERFYEWAVEGLLYLPAAAVALAALLQRLARG